MSSRAKAKGTRWESDVVHYINEQGAFELPHAERLVQTGNNDQGDIRIGPFILQCKDQAQYDLSGSVDDARDQLAHYKRVHPAHEVDFSAAVIKRRRRAIAEGYVVMTLAEFTRLLGLL